MSELSDRSPDRRQREDFAKEKQKRMLSNVTYQQQIDKCNNGGTAILMNSYQTVAQLAQRFHLNLNVIPTLFGSFEPQPMYLRTDPITERAVATPLPLEQVRTFIDMVHEYNVRRADVLNVHQSKNKNEPMIPLFVTKTQNDPNENLSQLDFFANSAFERFNRSFGKSYMVFQRYVPCKGSNANVVRCIYNKERKSMQVYRIQTTHKMSGHMDEDPGSPGKRGHHSGNDSLYMTREKVISYAKDIIKHIKDRMESMDEAINTTI